MHDKDEMSQTFIELSKCLDSSVNDVTLGMEDNINKYDVEIREIEQRLFEGEMEDQEQQGIHVLRDMKETEVLIQQDKDGRNQQFKRDEQQHENEFEEGIRLQEYINWKHNEEQEISLAVQRKPNEERRYRWRTKKQVKWKLLQQRWNGKLMNDFRELEQIHIDLLEKKRLKGM